MYFRVGEFDQKYTYASINSDERLIWDLPDLYEAGFSELQVFLDNKSPSSVNLA
jgi:hypothetical protein